MKGFWHMIESIFSVIILIAFLISLGTIYIILPSEPNMSLKGYEILKNLDDQNELRSYAVNNDWSDLNSKITIAGYNHTIQICDLRGSCSGGEASGDSIWTSIYLISGDSAYQLKEIRLLIW